MLDLLHHPPLMLLLSALPKIVPFRHVHGEIFSEEPSAMTPSLSLSWLSLLLSLSLWLSMSWL